MIIGVKSEAVNFNGAYDLNDPVRLFVRNQMIAHLSAIDTDDSICIVRASIGFELDFIYACHENEIPYVIYIPFKGIEERWPPQIQKVYKEILKLSKQKFVKNGGGYSPKKIKSTQDFIETTANELVVIKNSERIFNQPIVRVEPVIEKSGR
jgi:uncharacterized phage-like protein YoqJ